MWKSNYIVLTSEIKEQFDNWIANYTVYPLFSRIFEKFVEMKPNKYNLDGKRIDHNVKPINKFVEK